MADALCREHPEVKFHPGRGEPTTPAKAVCARCAVRAECLDYALSRPADQCLGVWGGTSVRERRALRRAAA
jgi:WhiB family transcriptional regulator, redox-sensing transcriptional regulator